MEHGYQFINVQNSRSMTTLSHHVAGKHVMYIIQYGKSLKEEGQLFYCGTENNPEQKQGLELLTVCYSDFFRCDNIEAIISRLLSA